MPNQPEEAKDMAFKQPEPAQISTISPKVTKDISEATGEYIEKRLIRYPNYDYQTGTTFFLSKKEKILVDAYTKTRNETEACRVLNAIMRAHGSYRAHSPALVSRWLRKPHVARQMAQRWENEGLVNWADEPSWKADGVKMFKGLVKATTVQASVWKEYGKMMGWYKENAPQVMHNTQINFVQSDGRA